MKLHHKIIALTKKTTAFSETGMAVGIESVFTNLKVHFESGKTWNDLFDKETYESIISGLDTEALETAISYAEPGKYSRHILGTDSNPDNPFQVVAFNLNIEGGAALLVHMYSTDKCPNIKTDFVSTTEGVPNYKPDAEANPNLGVSAKHSHGVLDESGAVQPINGVSYAVHVTGMKLFELQFDPPTEEGSSDVALRNVIARKTGSITKDDEQDTYSSHQLVFVPEASYDTVAQFLSSLASDDMVG